MKQVRRPYSKVGFQEENALKEDFMTLNHNFLRKWQIFGKRKANKTQRNFGVFGSRRIPSMFYMKSFSRKTRSKGSKTFPKQENFLQKDPRKNSQRGFPRFSKNSFKEKWPFPKSFLKKILESLCENPLKKHQKRPLQKSSKSPPFSQHKSPFYRRRFRKYFQIKNLFSKKTQE